MVTHPLLVWMATVSGTFLKLRETNLFIWAFLDSYLIHHWFFRGPNLTGDRTDISISILLPEMLRSIYNTENVGMYQTHLYIISSYFLTLFIWDQCIQHLWDKPVSLYVTHRRICSWRWTKWCILGVIEEPPYRSLNDSVMSALESHFGSPHKHTPSCRCPRVIGSNPSVHLPPLLNHQSWMAGDISKSSSGKLYTVYREIYLSCDVEKRRCIYAII